MGIIDALTNVATGGLGRDILSAVEKYFPPDVSPEQRENFRLAAENIELQRARDFAAAQADAERALNERISMYEGTASDLRQMPVIGPAMLFLRGAQRPAWGIATLCLDYEVFSGAWKLGDTVLLNCFFLINFLVLIFLFGERAVVNVFPLLKQLFDAKAAK